MFPTHPPMQAASSESMEGNVSVRQKDEEGEGVFVCEGDLVNSRSLVVQRQTALLTPSSDRPIPAPRPKDAGTASTPAS